MKILHTESSQGYGGQELRIVNEAKGMLSRGHDVCLICAPNAQIEDLARERGIPVEVLKIDKKRLAGVFAMRRWIKDNQPDIINTHSSTDSWLVALATRLMRRRPSVVRTRHISAPISRSPTSRWLYTRSCEHVVTTGENLRQTLVKDHGFPSSQITSVRTGIDLKVFKPADRAAARKKLGIAADPFVVGIVATLRSWKGHGYLIEAFRQLQLKDARLLIIGDGPQWQALHEQVATAKLDQTVTFVGRQNNISDWMQAIDVVCLPSYANEGVPQSLMQAQACGVPAITTLTGSIGEAVIPDQTGLIVEPKDSTGITEAIRRLHDDVELRHSLGSAASVRARQQFSTEGMLDAMEAIFMNTQAGRRRSP